MFFLCRVSVYAGSAVFAFLLGYSGLLFLGGGVTLFFLLFFHRPEGNWFCWGGCCFRHCGNFLVRCLWAWLVVLGGLWGVLCVYFLLGLCACLDRVLPLFLVCVLFLSAFGSQPDRRWHLPPYLKHRGLRPSMTTITGCPCPKIICPAYFPVFRVSL